MLVKPTARQRAACESPAETIDFDRLVRDLDDGECVVRRRAARDLGEIAAAGPHLVGRLAIETEPSARAAILSALIRLRSVEVVDGLVAFLRSEDVGLRNAVIEALQEMPEEALPSLRLLLTDSDSDVRIFAVNILNGLCHPGMVPCLVEVIATDSHVNVCMAAVDGLAEAGDVEAIPPLAALARRFADVPFVAFAVAAATRRIRGH